VVVLRERVDDADVREAGDGDRDRALLDQRAVVDTAYGVGSSGMGPVAAMP
jgi:hypothetical protein